MAVNSPQSNAAPQRPATMKGKEVLVLGVIIFSLWDPLMEYGQKAQGMCVWGSPAVRQTCFTGTYLGCLTHPPSLPIIGMEVAIRK